MICIGILFSLFNMEGRVFKIWLKNKVNDNISSKRFMKFLLLLNGFIKGFRELGLFGYNLCMIGIVVFWFVNLNFFKRVLL